MKRILSAARKLLIYVREVLLLPVSIRRIRQQLGYLEGRIDDQCSVIARRDGRQHTVGARSAPRISIMTIVIMRENAKFLDEWIAHHLDLGIDEIVVYDNSASRFDDTFGVALPGVMFNGQDTNKHNVNYLQKLGVWASHDAVQAEISRLLKKYEGRLRIVEWSRKNKAGVVSYFQCDAIRDFVLRFNDAFDYCVAIDTDEFLLSERGWSVRQLVHHMEERGLGCGLIGQRRFLYRFASLDTQVRQIPWVLAEDVEGIEYNAGKCVFKLSEFCGFSKWFYIHSIPTLENKGKIDGDDFRFHHYGYPSFRERTSLSELSDEENRFLNERFRRDDSMFRFINSTEVSSPWGLGER